MKISTYKPAFFVFTCLFSFILFSACEKSDPYIDWKVMNDDWYEAHKNDPGFTVTKSGLSYRRIIPETEQPSPERKPNATDIVSVVYSGTYINGTEFKKITLDNNNKEIPDILSLASESPGFREGLMMMREGETFEFYIPYKIGYGTKASGAIPPYSTLKFVIKLVDSKAY